MERGRMPAERGRIPVAQHWKKCRPQPWAPSLKDGTGTPADAALRLALAYVRLSQVPFDDRLEGSDGHDFKQFSSYVLGYYDGIPKTPQWAARHTGIPSYAIKALARRCPASSHLAFGTGRELADLVSQAASLDEKSFVRPGSRYAGLPCSLIGGTVYDYELDEVIAGALVTIMQVPGGRGVDPEGSGGDVLRVMTDDCGNFLVDAPEQIAYVLSIEKEGYARQEWGPIHIQDGANLRDFPMFMDEENIIWW